MDESCGDERRCEVDAPLLALSLAGLALLLLLGGLLLAGEARAETIIVDANGNGNYTRIQEAIDNATTGDTIRVWAGTYYEKVTVNKTLTLIGNGSTETTIDGSGGQRVVKVTVDWVNLSGFKISNGSIALSMESDWNQIFEMHVADMRGVDVSQTSATGGTAFGFNLDDADNNLLQNNTISSLTGGRAGGGDMSYIGGLGGVAAGIYLENSHNNTIQNNTISGLTGGQGGDGGAYRSGGLGGIAAGIYLQNSSQNRVENNTKYSLTGGQGGTGGYKGVGGAGGVATGIFVEDSTNNTIENNTISSLTGGQGGRGGGGNSRGGVGGVAAGIYVLNSSRNTVQYNTIFSPTGGKGGHGGGGYGSGGGGGVATGLYLASSNTNTLENNSLSNPTGGKGGTGGLQGSGGVGGTAVGIYLEDSSNATFSNNTHTDLTGGQGGNGGAGGPGGTGGVAAGIYLELSFINTFWTNTFSNLTEGQPGTKGSTGSDGATGFATGAWIKDSTSLDNTLTPVKLQNSYYMPDSARWNTVNGAPLLYFFNYSNLRISGLNAQFGVTPLTIGDAPSTGGAYGGGGHGGVSTGLYLGDVTASIIENNSFYKLTGGSGGTGGYRGAGGRGGKASGIYLENSNNNTLQNNSISNLTGGQGGTGGYQRPGRAGGIAAGIYVESSSNNTLSNNIVDQVTGGKGGTGGYEDNGGAGGIATGLYLEGSSNNTFYSNPVSNLTGGRGGNGGYGHGKLGGAGGVTAGLYLKSSTNNSFESSTLTDFTGGQGGTGGTFGSGGRGGIAAGFYFTGSSGNALWQNALSSLTGGQGGTGGWYGSGGTGGVAVGSYFMTSNDNHLWKNAFSNLTRGEGGAGGDGSDSEGTAGFATGVWIRYSTSLENTLTPLRRQGLWNIPISLEWNLLNGAPLLYFYNLTNLRISRINTTFMIAPLTIGGLPSTGGTDQDGGEGGISTGLYLGKVTNSIIEDNTVSNFIGGPGGTGGYRGSGGEGGLAAGLYLEGSSNNTFENNTISSLTGGQGGTGGRSGSGGTGGVAAGIYLEDSIGNAFENNTISNLTGGLGGKKGSYGSNGTSSAFYHFYLKSSSTALSINSTSTNISWDSSSSLTVRNYIQVQTFNATFDPYSGADVRIEDNDIVIYSTSGYGGSDPITGHQGYSTWALVTDRIYNGNSTATENMTEVWVIIDNRTLYREVNMSITHTEVFRINATSNTPPTAQITSITPSLALANTSITFTGQGTAFDGNISAYRWRSSYGLLSTNANFTTSSFRPGYYTIYFSVVDDEGAWSLEATETLIINLLPNAIIDNITLSAITEGEPVTLNGSGDDPDGYIVGYRWHSSLVVGNLSYNASFTTDELPPGNHTLYFAVQDDLGFWSEEVNVSLHINARPVAIIANDTTTFAHAGDEVLLNGSGADADGEVVTYLWTSDFDGPLGNASSLSLTNLTPGNHTLYFQVRDDFGAWSEPVEWLLGVNARPVAVISNDTDAFAHEGEPVLLNGSGTDADGEVVEYRWESDRDGPLGNASSLTFTNLTPGTHNLSFRVRDDFGAWSEAAVWSLQVNARPVVALVVMPQVVLRGGAVALAVSASDSDGNVTRYRYRLDHSASSFNLTGEYNTSDHGPLDTAGWPLGNYTLAFQAGDSEGGWSDPALSWLYVNVPPLAVIDEINVVRAANGTIVVTLAGHGSDDEAIAVLAWRSDLDGPLGGGSRLVLANLTPGTHTITLRVQDELGAWSEWAAWSEPVTVAAASDGNGGNNALLALLALLAAAGAGGAAAWRYRSRTR